eukprot:3374464-Ditylum_brightwellii.AAC.1
MLLADNYDKDVIVDMRTFNKRGNTDSSKYQMFWDAVAAVMEREGTGAHARWHTSQSNTEEEGGVVYASTANS